MGRYLKTMIFSPRSWRTTSAVTTASLDDGRADLGAVAVGDEQHAIEVDRLARLGVEALDRELAAELDAVLLAACFDDCVHGSPGRAA